MPGAADLLGIDPILEIWGLPIYLFVESLTPLLKSSID